MSHKKSVNEHEPNFIERPRLLDRLDVIKSKKLLLVTGFPAQGKTTLLKKYINRQETDHIWIKLDRTDCLPKYFCETILSKVKKLVPEKRQSVLRDKLDQINDTSSLATTHLRRWALKLMQEIESDAILVIDNMEKVIINEETLDIIEGLLNIAHTGLRMIFISRELPCLRLQKMIIQGVAIHLGEDDLRLTFEEFQLFWSEFFDMSLSPYQEKKMYDLTRGWIGALVLLNISAKQDQGKRRYDLTTDLLKGKLPREFDLFFLQEAFEIHSKQVQKILCKLSNLDRMYPEFIRKLIPGKPCEAIIESLFRANIFIEKLVDGNGRAYYAFHPIFKIFITHRQMYLLTEFERNNIFFLIAEIYKESNHRHDLAIEFYLRAGKHNKALILMHKLGLSLATKDKYTSIAKWLNYFSDKQINSDSLLQFYRLMTQSEDDDAIYADVLNQAFQFFSQKNQIEPAMTCITSALKNLFISGSVCMSATSLLNKASYSLKTINASLYPEVCARLWLQVAITNIMGIGRIKEGLIACETSRLISLQQNNKSLQLEASIFSSIANAFLGRTKEAKKLAPLMEKQFSVADDRLKSLCHLSVCIFKLVLGPDSGFVDLYRKLNLKAEEKKIQDLEPFLTFTKAIEMIYLDKLNLAEEMMLSLSNLLNSKANKTLQYHMYLLWAQLKYLQNDHKTAGLFITKASDLSLSLIQDDGFYKAYANQIAGIIAFQSQNYKSSKLYLYQALKVFKKQQAALFKCETLLILGTVEITSGNLKTGCKHIKQAIDLVLKNNYTFFWLLPPPIIGRSMYLALKHEVKGTQIVIKMLATNKRYLTELEKHFALSSRLSRKNEIKAQVILKSIYRARMSELLVTTLGSFSVRKIDFPLQELKLEGIQPVNLLKACIAKGCYNIPKDLIMEELWPLLDPTGMERAFKIALHRLRKMIEPKLNRKFGSSYVHFAKNKLTLDKDLITIDIIEYDQYVKRAKQLAAVGNNDEALYYHEKSERLFVGPFLPDNLYDQWAIKKRDQLMQKLIEQLTSQALIYENFDRKVMAIKAYKSILQYDHFNEHAVQKLMKLYNAMGCKTLSINTYRSFKERIKNELDLIPDNATQNLFENLLVSIQK